MYYDVLNEMKVYDNNRFREVFPGYFCNNYYHLEKTCHIVDDNAQHIRFQLWIGNGHVLRITNVSTTPNRRVFAVSINTITLEKILDSDIFLKEVNLIYNIDYFLEDMLSDRRTEIYKKRYNLV